MPHAALAVSRASPAIVLWKGPDFRQLPHPKTASADANPGAVGPASTPGSDQGIVGHCSVSWELFALPWCCSAVLQLVVFKTLSRAAPTRLCPNPTIGRWPGSEEIGMEALAKTTQCRVSYPPRPGQKFLNAVPFGCPLHFKYRGPKRQTRLMSFVRSVSAFRCRPLPASPGTFGGRGSRDMSG